jgi:porphobilinogen deaminase
LLGIEYRQDDAETGVLLQAIADPAAGVAFEAERAFLAELDGGCHVPAGAVTEVSQTSASIQAFLSREGRMLRVNLTGPRAQASELGREAARQLKAGTA